MRLPHPRGPLPVSRSIVLAHALAAAVTAAGLSGCNHEQAKAAAPQMPPPLVQVATAKAADVPVYLDEIGKASALESVTITPQVAGKIVERHFEDGADLKKGQLLFTIDEAPYKATLASAQAQLAQSKAALDLANIEFQRYQGIANTRAVSKSDFDVKKNAVDVANAQVASAEAAVTAAQLNVDYCAIKSPIDGRAGARLVDVGNIVKANEGALLSVQKIDPIYADFTVNEGQLASVRDNMANGTLKTMVKLPGDTGDGRAGELTFLDNSVQDGSGTIKLRATIPNKDLHFWPGQFVNVRLVLKIEKNAVLVPSAAPQLGQTGPYVLVLKDDMTAAQQPIVPGQAQGDWVVIDKGVSAGDKVVVEGQIMVRPGGKVRLEESAPTGAQQQQPAAAASEAQPAKTIKNGGEQ